MSVEQAEVPVEVVSQKNGGCMKVFLYFLAFLGLCSCCCCFGIFGLSGYMAYAIQNSITTDAGQVSELTDQYFGTVAFPEGFAPKAGIDLKFPLVGQQLVVATLYEDGAGSSLVFGACVMNLPKESLADIKMEVSKSFKKSQAEVTVLEEKTIEVEINGEKFPILFSTVKDEKDVKMLQVAGAFTTSKSSFAFALFLLDPQKFDEQTAIEILKSIN